MNWRMVLAILWYWANEIQQSLLRAGASNAGVLAI
jgi:hypothetical protein